MKSTAPKLAKRLDAHFLACTAAVGAAAAFAPGQEAKAAIVFVDLTSSPILIPVTTAGIYLNLATGVFATAPAGAAGWDFNPWGTTTFNFWANNAASPGDGVIVGFAGGNSVTLTDNLPFGTLIDASGIFGRSPSSETTGSTAFNLNSNNNFIGIRFFNETTGATDFGWVQIHIGATLNDPSRSIIAYGFDNTGAGITVGAVPEPGTYATLGLMALGALGVRFWKRAARAV